MLLEQAGRRLGLVAALGSGRQGKLALWQVLARVIDQGSRLSAVRLAGHHAACDVLGLDAFNEDDLYGNLAWLADHQAQIESQLYRCLHGPQGTNVFLYDVTSSYLEGSHNALAAWGYNRDGKPGKQQIVIGLLCDAQGNALSIEVFAGNTSDPKTLGSQIKKAAERFGAQEVTFVGDRGMIKGPQVQHLGQEGFHYITAITKPQIEDLLARGVLQMELFEDDVAEVSAPGEGVRYVLRRNPRRAEELEQSRQSKQGRLAAECQALNEYLAGHRRARVQTARRKLAGRLEKLKVAEWLRVAVAGRGLRLVVAEAALGEVKKLDGCYVLKTDLKAEQASADVVHERYKDLSLVEQDFRTCKTGQLEMRPVFVQLAASTRGHALVVMLAHRLVKELERCWSGEDLTVAEGIAQLSTLCVTEVVVGGRVRDALVPEPRGQVRRLLALAGVELPQRIRSRGVCVATRKKLVGQRPRRSK
jgi:transposase